MAKLMPNGFYRFTRGRFGLSDDPIGAQVKFTYRGRTLLGDVYEVYNDEVTGSIRLEVRHFNGEPWPLDPPAVNVDVLSREADHD